MEALGGEGGDGDSGSLADWAIVEVVAKVVLFGGGGFYKGLIY